MKGRIALLLALFTLFLSTESSFMLHFCHNQFVAASVNKEISTCCKKKEHPGPYGQWRFVVNCLHLTRN
jgi:hypothetical protein